MFVLFDKLFNLKKLQYVSVVASKSALSECTVFITFTLLSLGECSVYMNITLHRVNTAVPPRHAQTKALL